MRLTGRMGFAIASLAIALQGLGLPAAFAERLGIVMLHGKQGRPQQLESYDALFAAQGYLSERPEMCWSHLRIYDRPYPDCLHEIDDAADRLKARGATDIVVLGMSLGGNAVFAYGARRTGLKGIIALAPAHSIEFFGRRPDIAGSIERARAMVAEGRGDAKATFAELNTGVSFTVTTTPKIYLSFLATDSPAFMPTNAARLTAPLLIVAGTDDRTQRGKDYLFNRVPANPLNRYVTVRSDHRGTPAAAQQAVLNWLKELERR